MIDIFIPVMMHRSVTRADSTPFRTLLVINPGVAVEPLREKLAAVSHAFEVNRLSGETGLSQETLKNVLNNRVSLEPAPTGASAIQKDYRRALTALGGAGGDGADDCVRECGEPDDGAGSSAGARDGVAGLDRRRARGGWCRWCW